MGNNSRNVAQRFTDYCRAKWLLLPYCLLAIIRTCGTLGRHLEVHMSDQSTNNDPWLSKLRSHLETECYGAGTVSQYMGVARRFVADLNKRFASQ